MTLGPVIKPPPPPEKPEWSPIKDRPGWWLHRDGVFKTYAPGGHAPESLKPEPDIAITTADGQEIVFIKGLKVRNLGTP